MRNCWETKNDANNGSTYKENNVSPMNVIFSMAHDTLAAQFVVTRGVHDIQERFW